MTRKLTDYMQSDLYDVFLNTDEHAETILYGPRGGQFSPVVAIVEHQETHDLTNGYEYQDELIIVTVGNDPNHAKGGVEQPYFDMVQPKNSDVIIRGEDEAADKFIISGNVIDEIEGGWRIEFRRYKANTIGVDWHQKTSNASHRRIR